jgi:hypothetical protein
MVDPTSPIDPQDRPPATRLASAAQTADLERLTARAEAAQADSIRLEAGIKRYAAKAQAAARLRGQLLTALELAKVAWRESRERFDAQRQAAAERLAERDKLAAELEQVRGDLRALENRPDNVVTLEHLPTPMAKTVFGEEIHLRLKDNRISVVPLEALAEEMKVVAQRMFQSSRQGEFEDVAGPIQGYIAKVAMVKTQGVGAAGGRLAVQQKLAVRGVLIQPLREPHGQDVNKVFEGSSVLDIELAGRDPAATTVTVWVYPDSFAAMRRLKEYLYRRGFPTAARPLPEHYPIIVSNRGSRSSAQ